MDSVLYVAMNGAKNALALQSVNANNLANVSTTGFRADLYQAKSVALIGEKFPTQVFSMPEETRPNLNPGTIKTTGRELDVSIESEGWIALQTPSGKEAYTRAGDLQINKFGQLSTGAGHLVLGNGGPIALPPSEKLEIGSDGTISIIPLGQGAEALAVLDRIKLVNPEKNHLIKGTDGLIYLKEGENAEPDANVRLVSGTLESSNVNAVEAIVNMISIARQFEVSMKLLKSSDENLEITAQLLQE